MFFNNINELINWFSHENVDYITNIFFWINFTLSFTYIPTERFVLYAIENQNEIYETLTKLEDNLVKDFLKSFYKNCPEFFFDEFGKSIYDPFKDQHERNLHVTEKNLCLGSDGGCLVCQICDKFNVDDTHNYMREVVIKHKFQNVRIVPIQWDQHDFPDGELDPSYLDYLILRHRFQSDHFYQTIFDSFSGIKNKLVQICTNIVSPSEFGNYRKHHPLYGTRFYENMVERNRLFGHRRLPDRPSEYTIPYTRRLYKIMHWYAPSWDHPCMDSTRFQTAIIQHMDKDVEFTNLDTIPETCQHVALITTERHSVWRDLVDFVYATKQESNNSAVDRYFKYNILNTQIILAKHEFDEYPIAIGILSLFCIVAHFIL